MESTDAVTRRLDAIIRLLMEAQFKEGKLRRGEQLLILDSVALTSREIGRILGQPSKDVASAIKKLRKSKKDQTLGFKP